MKMIILKNVGGKDITDYPIAEPDLGSDGEVRYDDNHNIISTGGTLLWSLNAEETKAFPEYVAEYLLKIYGQPDLTAKNKILEVIGEEKAEEVEVAKGGDTCQYCGKVFDSIKGKALHFAAKHPEKL